ncbi:GAF domain-containing protein [Blastomonas sp.]|uniref:GAF domain-containing protein n=1 Tax=Blastomonas sp. TaxID=1909299 RepID=UPI00391A0A45
MNDDILTTAQTAKLLGVSVRTAQLLIEGGSVPSWKTPGGHRRVYRRDVEAIITAGSSEPASPSANVLAVVRGSMREELALQLGGFNVRFAENTAAALLAIGEREPRIVIAEYDEAETATALIGALLAQTNIAPNHMIVVGTPDGANGRALGHAIHARDTAAAVVAVKDILADPPNLRLESQGLPFPVGLNEHQRLIALERSGLVDSAPEEAFDRIAWLAANTLDAPISLITLLTPTRQFFKARVGLDMTDTPRSWAFCNHTVLQKDVFAVEDLSLDPRFSDNPAVADDPSFRFYAGAPILDGAGFALGSLCIIDFASRTLDDRQTRTLHELAELASTELRLREMKRSRRSPVSRSAITV